MQLASGSAATSTVTLPDAPEFTSGAPATRPQLCRLTQPHLRQAQHTPRFYFHDATIILVLEGSIGCNGPHSFLSTATDQALVLVDPRTTVDLVKTPKSNGEAFRSILLEISGPVLAAFQAEFTEPTPRPTNPMQQVSVNNDILFTLWSVCESIEAKPVSDIRLRYRLLDLLSVLAEHGHAFAPVTRRTISDLLREMVGETPDRHWTAQEASAELAMSEATLRRRLAKENARFDEVLLDVRMHHAMALLQSTNWSVPQIAHACGYRSRARFSDRFRDRFGQSPAAVR